jgi:hypothetical protein
MRGAAAPPTPAGAVATGPATGAVPVPEGALAAGAGVMGAAVEGAGGVTIVVIVPLTDFFFFGPIVCRAARVAARFAAAEAC